MIIKNVPFVEDKEERYASCQGPPTVMMVYKYFKPDKPISFSELYSMLRYKPKTWFFEVYITRFFHQLKIPVKYYSNVPIRKIGNDAEYFKKIANMDLNNEEERDEYDVDNYDSAVEYVLSNNLFEKKEVDVEFIKEQLNKNKLVIATVNRNVLTGKAGYKGHFILIKGYDDEGFICNDALLGKNLKINFEKFKRAFHSPDSDIVVIG